MEALSHDSLLYGDFSALGSAFHPMSQELARSVGPRLLAPNSDFEPPFADAVPTWTLQMEIPIGVIVYMVRSDGHRFITSKLKGGTVDKPASSIINVPDTKPYTYVIVEAASGAYVSGFNATAGDTVTIGPDSLRPVNNPGLPGGPGEFPSPTNSGSPIPADSPPVLVAAGVLDNGLIVARTQHWQKSEDSYSLPGCSSTSVTLTEMTGLTKSSSTLEKFATEVGASARAGWGPISASLSASMSRSSTTTQEVTITSTTEATVVRGFTNPYEEAMVVFLWQLVDRVLVLGATYKIQAILETVVLPAIPRTYDAFGKLPSKNPVKCLVPPPGAFVQEPYP